MRKLMRVLVKIFMLAIVKIYSYSFHLKLLDIRNRFYTMWIKDFIGSVGEHSSIHYPCSLQGGGEKRISIGNHTCIKSHVILGCWVKYGIDQTFVPEIRIGNYSCIGEYNQFTAINKITIGDGLLTGSFVYIGDNAHGGLSWEEADIPPAQRKLKSKGEINIGKNVWLGDKVAVLAGVTIGDNVIVGANSVVTHNIPSNSIAVGAPARVIKSL